MSDQEIIEKLRDILRDNAMEERDWDQVDGDTTFESIGIDSLSILDLLYDVDQVFGQSWAFQLGLGRLYSPEHIMKALQSLWKYNFAPDVGPFKAVYKRG